jgi:hypothetical protein
MDSEFSECDFGLVEMLVLNMLWFVQTTEIAFHCKSAVRIGDC